MVQDPATVHCIHCSIQDDLDLQYNAAPLDADVAPLDAHADPLDDHADPLDAHAAPLDVHAVHLDTPPAPAPAGHRLDISGPSDTLLAYWLDSQT